MSMRTIRLLHRIAVDWTADVFSLRGLPPAASTTPPLPSAPGGATSGRGPAARPPPPCCLAGCTPAASRGYCAAGSAGSAAPAGPAGAGREGGGAARLWRPAALRGVPRPGAGRRRAAGQDHRCPAEQHRQGDGRRHPLLGAGRPGPAAPGRSRRGRGRGAARRRPGAARLPLGNHGPVRRGQPPADLPHPGRRGRRASRGRVEPWPVGLAAVRLAGKASARRHGAGPGRHRGDRPAGRAGRPPARGGPGRGRGPQSGGPGETRRTGR